MQKLFAAATEWLMQRRSSLPGWMNRAMESVARNPDGVLGRLAGRMLHTGDVAATTIPQSPLRVYIGPTNYAGQGFAWARALEAADPEIGARNVAVELPGSLGFRADTVVPIAAVNSSDSWADAEWAAATAFSHVLIEAERSLFGRRFGRSLPAEIDALERARLSVAYLCHGTDIRDPDAHQRRTPWSPYPDDPRTAALRTDAAANIALLRERKLPTFVSTPDLIDDVPWALWCPVVVDAAPFATHATPLTAPALRVVHVSTSAVQKGSHLIEPALQRLVEAGTVELNLVTGAPAAEMPQIFHAADVVLDQFRLGSYGVAACEAMAAGRVVVGHVLPEVRARVKALTGLTLPIIEATPDTLTEVLETLNTDRAAARRAAAAGPTYVAAVHSGVFSAGVLIDNWIRASR